MLTSVFAVNHSVVLLGLMALYPPSPPFTFNHEVFTVALAVAGEPLSCVPPRIVLGSVGCCENETNWVIDPSVWFRLSNWFVRPQVPVASPRYPSSAR